MSATEPQTKPLIGQSRSNVGFDHAIQNRKWLFIGIDWDDNETYLGADGLDDENQSAFFFGTHEEANTEADNRGNAWEDRTGNLLAKIVFESHGVAGPNDRVEGRDAASSRRVPSHDGLEGNGTGHHE